MLQILCCRIRQAVKDNAEVIDVDGSYLYKKCRRLEDSGLVIASLNPPSSPITGWECVTESNANDMAKRIPCVTAGTIYVHLSSRAGHESGEETFRALT